MKVLHLADGPRNIRAERAALVAKKEGINTHFIAGNVTEDLIKKSIFKKKHFINLTPKNHLLMDLKDFEKSLSEFIEEVNPDIIHSHNIFMGKIAKKTGLPYLYDDHELWSQKIKCFKRTGLRAQLGITYQRFFHPRWEKELANNTSVLVPSNGILNFYETQYKTNNVYYFPNMPVLEEVNKIKLKKQRTDSLITAAIGVSTKSTSKHRKIDGFVDLWKTNNDIGKILIIGQDDLKSSGNVISTGRVSHNKCYEESSIGHLGIIPFKPYKKYHIFSGANKAYLYIHAGLGLITPYTQVEFKPVIKEIGMGYQFKDYTDLVEYLRKNKDQLMNTNRDKIISIARKKFVLDNFSNNLKMAYEKAVEING